MKSMKPRRTKSLIAVGMITLAGVSATPAVAEIPQLGSVTLDQIRLPAPGSKVTYSLPMTTSSNAADFRISLATPGWPDGYLGSPLDDMSPLLDGPGAIEPMVGFPTGPVGPTGICEVGLSSAGEISYRVTMPPHASTTLEFPMKVTARPWRNRKIGAGISVSELGDGAPTQELQVPLLTPGKLKPWILLWVKGRKPGMGTYTVKSKAKVRITGKVVPARSTRVKITALPLGGSKPKVVGTARSNRSGFFKTKIQGSKVDGVRQIRAKAAPTFSNCGFALVERVP